MNRIIWCVFCCLAFGCEGPEEAVTEIENVSDTGVRTVVDAAVEIQPDAVLLDAAVFEPDISIDAFIDSDGDGVTDAEDAFPDDPRESVDTDDDGVGDNGDAFPDDPDETMDTDGDGVGDNADAFPRDRLETTDSDGDGVGDNTDLYPNDATESADSDGDGIGNNADDDDDNDGLSDTEELEFGSDCKRSNPLLADTDGDGVTDPNDPYPYDQFAEFLVRKRPDQRIDLFLSNRDGTFTEGVIAAEPIDYLGRTLGYDYFSVADFDGDGVMDFLAHSDPLTVGEPTRNVYLFTRDAKADEFVRRLLGTTDILIWGAVADVDHDNRFDVVHTVIDRPNNVAGGEIHTFLNNDQPNATCVWGDTPEAGCFFVRRPPLDITGTIGGQWVAKTAFQAVNLNPQLDDHLDLTLSTYSSGGNSPTKIFSLLGNGDGTFQSPIERFVHNANRRQAPANTIMFADFDGDQIGDVHVGFDDDGRPGESWTYFGVGDGTFEAEPVMALDINPTDAREMNGGGENLGREASGRTFDFDFDGHTDLIIGVHHVNYDDPGQTRLYRGRGDGTFHSEYTVIGPEIIRAGRLAIPQPLCPNYQILRE